MPREIETRVLMRNDEMTPLGRLKLAGYLKDSKGVPVRPMRVFGSYALVYLLAGSGLYRDANRCVQKVRAGDVILVFPELAHHYGPRATERWDEIYLVFDGPVFDLWRETGLLSSAHPICHVEPIDLWRDRLEEIATANAATQAGRLQDLCRFLSLLTDILTTRLVETADPTTDRWLPKACSLLGENLNASLDLTDVADQVALSYESFRKRFQQQMGVPPARYRAAQRIATACELMQQTQMTNKQLADNLGFSDEFYFSKRFKQITGMTPREYRLSLSRRP